MTNNWGKKAFQEISQRKRAYLIEINSRQFKSSSFHRFSIEKETCKVATFEVSLVREPSRLSLTVIFQWRTQKSFSVYPTFNN